MPRFAWRALAILPIVACTGNIDAARTRGPGSTTTTTTSPTPGSGPGPTQPTPTTATCAAPLISTPLTHEEYVNTVSDLLGFDVSAAVKFSDANGRTYQSGVHLSALQAEDLLNTAAAIADKAVSANLSMLLPCDPATGEGACADAFIDKFGARATRRPLTADAKTDLRALFDAGRAKGDFANGIRWVLDGLLQSPDFLYHLVPRPANVAAGTVVALDDFTVAERLAYFLWGSPPDQLLWDAAAKGALRSSPQVQAQVTRMRADPRAARTREDFYRSWLNLDLVTGLTRDDPAYTPELARSLATSALTAIHDVYGGDGKSDTLLGSSKVFVDPVLAKVYGSGPSSGTAFQPIAFDKERRGLLTHPALMAIIAEHDTSDPIHRGKFVFTRLLCQSIPDPPNMVPDLPPLAANLTTRQRLVAHRAAPSCAACHQLFDPIGLAFENYDALGRFRATEHGLPIDSSGEVGPGLDVAGTFPDGFTLMDRLAHSKDARRCLADEWYEYATRRAPDTTDHCALDAIEARFGAGGDLNDLLSTIALADTLRNGVVGQE